MDRRKLTMTVSLAIAVSLIVWWGVVRSVAQTSQKSESRPAPTSVKPPTVLVTTVALQELKREIRLPGELQAYQDVGLYPKVQGFVEYIGVDRGSWVKHGQLLVRMSAPELLAQREGAEAKTRAAHSQHLEAEMRVRAVSEQRLEAEAKLASDEGTYKRLKAASATPGVVAENDVEVAQRTVEADRARVALLSENEKTARKQVETVEEDEEAVRGTARSVGEIESYLRIAAPFDGIIIERNVHNGSFVGPSAGSPMLRIQQISPLRLLIPVPEIAVSGIRRGMKVSFTVPAFPGEMFSGSIERIGHSLDVKTRTMLVELDVDNRSGKLAPGMFPEVVLPTRRPRPSLFVPPSAVATTTERTFIIRVHNDVAEWVDVKRGLSMGDHIEVFGNLQQGDQVAVRGTDELRVGTRVVAKQALSAN